MRDVIYDLYKGTTLFAKTEDFDRALDWKNRSSSNYYKVRLVEVTPEVSDATKEWNKKMIAKRAERRVTLK